MKNMIVADDQYVTRRDLVEAFEDFGKTFAITLTESITSLFRDELDSKLAATENRLKRDLKRDLHDDMEEMLDDRTNIILQGMHDVVVRLETKDDDLDRRVSRLESKID